MRTLLEKIQQVEELFNELETEIDSFKNLSKIKCLSGCFKCCINPEIEATVLEFLPFALYIVQAGREEEWLAKIDANSESDICAILDESLGEKIGGGCSEYKYRGLICRLFGYSASFNKYGSPVYVTCKTIKTEFKTEYETVDREIKNEMQIPVMKNYYFKLYAIDINLSSKFYPINDAIRRAIGIVSNFMYFESLEKDQ